MSETQEILRQKRLLGRSHREVARSSSVSAGVVGSMLARAAKVGLTTWGEVEMLDDAELDEHLHGRTLEPTRPLPDCAWIHAERSKPGVPLQLLWNSPCTRGWTHQRSAPQVDWRHVGTHNQG